MHAIPHALAPAIPGTDCTISAHKGQGRKVKPLVQLEPMTDGELVNRHLVYISPGWDSLRRVSYTLSHSTQYNA